MAEKVEQFIYEHGWPADTPEQEATTTTMDRAQQHCAGTPPQHGGPWEVVPGTLQAEVYATPAHAEAGEYVVKVIGDRRHTG